MAKLIYIDRIKVTLTVLVILHHTFITYGGPGGWYFTQKTTLLAALLPMTMFVAVNQAFFMGFFFFLSAIFIPRSYAKKGGARFVGDRLLRLGLPLMFYSFILSPLLNYIVYHFGHDGPAGFWQYLGAYDDWIDFGVLWFAAALLLFTLLYAAWKKIWPATGDEPSAAPSLGRVLLFAAMIGVASFGVRIVFPVGWVWHPLGFQFGHFLQYISLFIFGLVAAERNWLTGLDHKTGRRAAILAGILILLLPFFFVLRITLQFPIDWFSGGPHWQSLLYAVWEQVTGFAIIVAFLCLAHRRYTKPSSSPSTASAPVFLDRMSRAAFAVYIFHPLLVISLAVAVKDIAVDPAVKLLAVAPLAVIGSFALGSLIVKIPGVNKVV